MRKLSGLRPLPRPKGELSRRSGGMLPQKILKFDVAKTAILCIFNAESKSFSSPGIPENRSYSHHLPETLTEDEHFSDTG